MLTILVALAATAAQAAPPPTTKCAYDRAALMALDQKSFDQDMTGGWRKLAAAGCYIEAADLLRDWRDTHGGTGNPRDAGILFWHEGQMRALAGQDDQAIALFDRSRKPAAEDVAFGWNFYVDGSIAFLRRDKTALEAARAKLAALPKPDHWAPVGPDGKPFDLPWPPNLRVLDSFLRCWGESYKVAYSCPAEPQAAAAAN